MIKVIGDLIEDEYWFGTTSRQSPEAYIPIVEKIRKETKSGGAGNVFKNISALTNAQCYTDTNYKIPHKLRIFCNDKIIARVDEEQYCPVEIDYNFIRKNDIIVLSDYNKGILHNIKQIIKDCNIKQCITIVDPKKTFDNYQDCTILKANYKEFWDSCKCPPNEESLRYISNKFNIRGIIVTCGEENTHMLYGSKYRVISPSKVEVMDVTGAGDVFVAALARGIELDLDFFNAAEVASEMASLSVTKVGTYVLNSKEYEDCLYKRLL